MRLQRKSPGGHSRTQGCVRVCARSEQGPRRVPYGNVDRVTIGPSLNVSRPLQRLHPAVILVGFLAACNSPVSGPSSSPTNSPSLSPTSTASGYRVVFTASTPSASEVFLYDSASSTPQQLVALGAGAPPEARFVSPQKIAYLDNSRPGSTQIISLELGTGAKSTDATVSGDVPAFAYSHDGAIR